MSFSKYNVILTAAKNLVFARSPEPIELGLMTDWYGTTRQSQKIFTPNLLRRYLACNLPDFS